MNGVPPAAQPGAPASGRGHRGVAIALVALATVTGLLMAFGIWAKRQLLETESWVETSTELLEREAIRDAVADYAVGQLYANVDLEGEIAQALPPRAEPLAGPAASALRQGAGEVARRALEDPRVQALWEDANRAAHSIFLQVIEGDGDAADVVTLDLAAIVGQIAERTGIPQGVVDRLPPDVAQLEVLDTSRLRAAQRSVDLFEKVAWALVAITLGLYAIAVAIAGDRRRETLRAVGISFLAIGVFLSLAQSWAGDAVVDALAGTAATEPAVAATWDVATSLLDEIAGAAIIYGAGFVVAAWLAGPTALATWIRRAAAPYFRRPAVALGTAAVVLALLFWWSPTPGMERLLPSLLLIALVLLGTEMLRRRTIAEFPDRVTPYSAAGLARTMAEQFRAARGRRAAAGADEPAVASDRIEALVRLGELRNAGVLTEGEFAAEKARVLAGGPAEMPGAG
ncbi:MAG TPA: hypothetical protein VIL04_01385 [Solirubrobacterales bacterium]